MKKVIAFIKKETVLCVSLLLALFSVFFVKPSAAYLDYIDFRTLGILLSLMLVVAGIKKAGVFNAASDALTKRTSTVTGLAFVLVLLCFFSSMLITNDVALITFVPFAIYTLRDCGQKNKIIPVVVLQTVAANLGSMLTPLGNPQNLYLYQLAGFSFGDFVMVMLPYTLASLVMIAVLVVLMCKEKKDNPANISDDGAKDSVRNAGRVNSKKSLGEIAAANCPDGESKILIKETVIFSVLFVLCLLVVFRVIHYLIALGVILIYLLIFDRALLKKADYSLLFTFIFFFVFTGNMGNLKTISDMLISLVAGKEILVAVLTSQVISNVPATLLLSGFTTDYQALLIGVNLGGLGTLIASMASLISYKAIAEAEPEIKGRYFKVFTVVNIVMLLILAGFAAILR